jgi:hypothetical protein
METADGRWRVEVGGAGATTWYTLIGPGVRRNLPSLTALVEALAGVGVDLSELREVRAAA